MYQSDKGEKIAKKIQGDASYREEIEKHNYAVLRESWCPALLYELSNLENTWQAYLLRYANTRQKMAEKIVNDIVAAKETIK